MNSRAMGLSQTLRHRRISQRSCALTPTTPPVTHRNSRALSTALRLDLGAPK